MLRRRRSLVVLSAELQRATLVRRLDHLDRHPLHAVLGFARNAASFSLLLKVGMLVASRIGRRREAGIAHRKPSAISRWLQMLRFVPVNRVFFPVLKFLNR